MVSSRLSLKAFAVAKEKQKQLLPINSFLCTIKIEPENS